jgi:hypothetical protein
MRKSSSARDVLGDLAALLFRRRRSRCCAAVLALVLGFNGIGFCLCTDGPELPVADPHGCCTKTAGHHAGTSVGAVVEPSSPCCGFQTAVPAFVARIDLRDVLHAPSPVAPDCAPLDASVASSTFVSASRSHGESPPRTVVLRI